MLIINKHNLNVVKAASKDETRPALNSLHVTPEYTEATDGHVLIRTEIPKLKLSDYPECEDSLTGRTKSYTVPVPDVVTAAKNMKKSTLPILDMTARIACKGKKVQILSTNLDTVQSISSTNMEKGETGNPYPDTDQVFPAADREKITIRLDVAVLTILIDYLKTAGKGKVYNTVDFEITPANLSGPIIAKATTNEQQKILALVMPFRITTGANMHDEPIYNPAYAKEYTLPKDMPKEKPPVEETEEPEPETTPTT